jgi:predicted transcriptional regulator
MARKHEAVQLLEKGFSPSMIARQMGITVSSVMGYLFNQVGEGRIRRSDIVFSIDNRLREAVESDISRSIARSPNYEPTIWKSDRIKGRLIKKGLVCDEEDLRVYLILRDARIVMGDMYEFIRDIEVFLHDKIRTVLSGEYGPDCWWREGVPESIRKACAVTREEDSEPANDPFVYTTVIHLKDIIDKNWGRFAKIFSGKSTSDKKELMSSLNRLNRIRNTVMHPVKARGLTDNDFAFVRDLARRLGLLKDQPPVAINECVSNIDDRPVQTQN